VTALEERRMTPHAAAAALTGAARVTVVGLRDE
jgi:hypothetical protein